VSYNFTGYCLPDDIRAALVNVPNENVKDEQLATYIELADQEIDSYIGQKYTLPITETSALKILRAFSITHAAYNVYGFLASREGNGVSDFATKKYEEVLKKLENIAAGKMSLVGKTDTSGIAGSYEGYKPTFNLGDVQTMNVDSNLLEDISSGAFIG
jgi:phage gp36-like protein